MAVKPLPMKDFTVAPMKRPHDGAPPVPPYIAAGSTPWPDIIRLPSLERELRLWLARQRIPALRAQSDRALLLYAPPGWGKSKSCQNWLAKVAHMHVVVIPAADLAAAYEHEHIERLEHTLAGCERLARDSGIDVAVVVDDIDAVISLPAGSIPTPNHELLRVALQSTLESPSRFVQASGRPIPFLFTANAMAGRVVHDAVFRNGRCTVTELKPLAAELTAIVMHHLRPSGFSENRIVAKLRRKYPDAPPAFYAALSNRLDAERIDALLVGGASDAAIESELRKPRALTTDVLRMASDMMAARAAAFEHGR